MTKSARITFGALKSLKEMTVDGPPEFFFLPLRVKAADENFNTGIAEEDL
jgi:hypothetical protein